MASQNWINARREKAVAEKERIKSLIGYADRQAGFCHVPGGGGGFVIQRDTLSPAYLNMKYGMSPVREVSLVVDGKPTGGKSLAQDSSIPVRDENGLLVEAVAERVAA